MYVTPVKSKTVSFQLPGSVQHRAATAPARIVRQQTPASQLQDRRGHPRITLSPTTSQITPTRPYSAVTSPTAKPDLIADIFDQPKPEQPRCRSSAGESAPPERTEKRAVSSTVTCASSQTPQVEEVVPMKEVLPGGSENVDVGNMKPKQEGRILSEHAKVTKARPIKNHRVVTPGAAKVMQSSQVTKMSHHVREQTNGSCFDHVRCMKHEVAKMREHLVKMEDEIKLANRAKSVLDVKIFDLRKCLSVNQQSISAQQKKSHREDIVSRKLREETHVLSRAKRKLEQHLVQMKSHLWNLDSMRKTIKSKIAILSRALELDAQRMKIYEGPVTTRPESVSKRRHYASACPLPQNTAGDEAVAQLCGKVMETIAASRSLRSEMKSLIHSAYSSKAEAHDKITAAVSMSGEDSRAHQNDLMLQKGKVRMQQNTLTHHKHANEIALGVALGPHSDSCRSVSEKQDRPLSRLRPGSAAAENVSTKHIANHITRQLSANDGRASRLATSDTILGKRFENGTQDSFIDSRMMRRRRAFLVDKR